MADLFTGKKAQKATALLQFISKLSKHKEKCVFQMFQLNMGRCVHQADLFDNMLRIIMWVGISEFSMCRV